MLNDVFENDKLIYLVLEYLEGNDLFGYVESRKFKISEYRVKEILYPNIKAVKHLHDNKIIHRDLKLENIMMTDKSDKAQPKIIDFGLAKILHLN